jgi:hypothetical protein
MFLLSKGAVEWLQKLYVIRSPKYLLSGLLRKKFADSWCRACKLCVKVQRIRIHVMSICIFMKKPWKDPLEH